jgi:hypothetical protein
MSIATIGAFRWERISRGVLSLCYAVGEIFQRYCCATRAKKI